MTNTKLRYRELINTKKSLHLAIDKQKVLKQNRAERGGKTKDKTLTYKRARVRVTVDFSSETMLEENEMKCLVLKEKEKTFYIQKNCPSEIKEK